jgi:putative phosphoesterase
MEKNVKRIGIISDTHGLLRDEAVHALRGSDLIIHAGDVGGPEIIETLKQIAPVVAVRGNTDHDEWGKTLPVTAVAETGSVLIYVIHDIQELDIDPAGGGFQMVVSGHSHKPSKSERDGVTYLNPGSAGPRRFQLPVAIARLDLSFQPWRIEFVNIMKFESGGPAAR